MPWIHGHSKYSVNDAMPTVPEIVERAVQLQYPSLALTDHGTMAGSVELYQQCRLHDINPLPGIEAYLTFNAHAKRNKTTHFGLVAYTEEGYRNLVRLNNRMVKNFFHKPRIDIHDLTEFKKAGALDGVLATTGCFFGVLPRLLRDAPDALPNVMHVLREAFGDDLYVEVQHHEIYDDDHDEDVLIEQLMDVAAQMSLPVVLGGDAHYCYPSERRAHAALKRLTSFDNPDDAVFPGDTGYHMRSLADYRRYLEPWVYSAVKDGLDDIDAKAKVVIPELDTFKMLVPPLPHKAPLAQLRMRALKGLRDLQAKGGRPAQHHHKYAERLDHELDIIAAGEFAEVVLIAADLCDWMAEQGIFHWIRGSATASLVLHVLGVNKLDPIPWKLDFARFLSTDRTKPPDIDIDVPTDRRGEVLEYLSERFTTRPIGTRNTYSVKEGVDGPRGSLVNKMYGLLDRIGESKAMTPDRLAMLKELSDYELYSNAGKHPGGLLLASAEDLQRLPLMRVGKGNNVTLATAYDKEEVEALGYVKLDVLGVKMLQALTLTAELSGVPVEQANPSTSKAWTMIGNGHTEGMFQLSGWAMKKGCRKLAPTNVGDLVVAQALFRPAMKEGEKEFMRRRRNKDLTPELNDVLRRAVGETHGFFLFQEQLITVLRELGMGPEELTRILKAVKASNKGTTKAHRTMQEAMKRVGGLMDDNATFTEEQKEMVFDAMKGYGEYGFNRAHATSYAMIGAITAYYAAHHPLEFWAGQLVAHTGDDDETDLLDACRSSGIRLLPPDVNTSKITYTVDWDRKGLRRGLRTVPGVGATAAANIVAGQPYDSLLDFAARAKVSGCKDLGLGHKPASCPGIVQALHHAKAFGSLT